MHVVCDQPHHMTGVLNQSLHTVHPQLDATSNLQFPDPKEPMLTQGMKPTYHHEPKF